MSEELAIINGIIDWHGTLRGHVKLVGDSISDQEALASLTKARPDWIPGRLEMLTEKQKRLQQTMSFLDEGLKNHFAYEEEALPPLLGELFMRALLIEHREIRKEIDDVKSMVADIKLEGLSREELLDKESQIQQVINSLSLAIEEHATREETLLEMLQRALEAE